MVVKLNLASGTDIKDPPWVNLDIVAKWPSARRGADIIWDARKDRIPFDDESVDEVYAGYLFLHIPRVHHHPVRDEVYRVLKKDGVLVVGEVDMEKVMERWLRDPWSGQLNDLIWGEQGQFHGQGFTEYDTHVQGFTEGTLRSFLKAGKFRLVDRISIHHPDVWYELTLRCEK